MACGACCTCRLLHMSVTMLGLNGPRGFCILVAGFCDGDSILTSLDADVSLKGIYEHVYTCQ